MFYMFCLINVIFLSIYALMYVRFRDGLYSAYPISRKKKRIGFKNYWWFESHFQKGVIHNAYYVNKIFFLSWCSVACITILLGYLPFMKFVITALIGLLGAFLVPIYLWGMIKSNQTEYGTSFVVFARRKHLGGFYSSFYEMLICLVPFFFVLVDLSIL